MQIVLSHNFVNLLTAGKREIVQKFIEQSNRIKMTTFVKVKALYGFM
jgi:hypothetical protein